MLYVLDMEFKDRIKTAREALGMTQQELADALDISAQAISQWENGRTTPERNRIRTAAKILKVDFHELIDGAPAPGASDFPSSATQGPEGNPSTDTVRSLTLDETRQIRFADYVIRHALARTPTIARPEETWLWAEDAVRSFAGLLESFDLAPESDPRTPTEAEDRKDGQKAEHETDQ